MSWSLCQRIRKHKLVFLITIFLISAVHFVSVRLYIHRWNSAYRVKILNPVVLIDSSGSQELELEVKGIIPIQKHIHFTTKWGNCAKFNCTHFKYIEDANKYCPRCTFTEGPSDYKSSDAVVFHGRFLNNTPTFRSSTQVWIYMLFENPVIQNGTEYPEGFKNAFNWTMTYRRDSDIFTPYGGFELRSELPIPLPSDKSSYHLQTRDFELFKTPSLKNLRKKMLAVWTASRCTSYGQREVIVEELKKYIKIDIFGKCGTKKCISNGIDDCKFNIASKYKFYFAFENAICEDYVTEKYFTTLLTEMVPVVYGGANYSSVFPPKSYINIADFDSIKALANYLTFLDKNPDEYLKYFEWRKDYWVFNNRFIRGWCSICDKVWELDDTVSKKVYKDAKKWWSRDSSGKKSACLSPNEVDWKILNIFKPRKQRKN